MVIFYVTRGRVATLVYCLFVWQRMPEHARHKLLLCLRAVDNAHYLDIRKYEVSIL